VCIAGFEELLRQRQVESAGQHYAAATRMPPLLSHWQSLLCMNIYLGTEHFDLGTASSNAETF
jgi:hypothetical protein